jgi:hypothetical protein
MRLRVYFALTKGCIIKCDIHISTAIQNTVVFESEAYNKSEVSSYKQSKHKYLTTHYWTCLTYLRV